jgi:hypothetical protein
MRHVAFAFLSLGLSTLTYADSVDDHFAAGMGGVAWGMTLDDLIAIRPGGEGRFSTAEGERSYSVLDDEPLFGIPRPGMRIQYHLGTDNDVRYIAIGVPYEQREQLLSELLMLFGRYRIEKQGIHIRYVWVPERHVQISVRATLEPKNGILEFWAVSLPQRRSAAR